MTATGRTPRHCTMCGMLEQALDHAQLEGLSELGVGLLVGRTTVTQTRMVGPTRVCRRYECARALREFEAIRLGRDQADAIQRIEALDRELHEAES